MKRFLTRLGALFEKETLHMLRDPQVVYLALGMPLVLVLLFGYAVRFDVEEVPIAIVDRDSSAASRSLVQRLDEGDAFDVVLHAGGEDEVEMLFRRDGLKAGLVIPHGYERSLVRGDDVRLMLMMDGADGTTARIALAYAAAIGQAETLEQIEAIAGEIEPPIDARVRTWFNPTMASAKFVVPGLVAMVLAVLCVLLSALTVAREWERGSMEQLFATPVDRLSVVLGKLLPYVFLGILQFMLVLTAGAWLFDVPMRGHFGLVLLSVVLFLVCVLGQGLFISMATKSQQLATQIGAVSAILPSMLLSGFLFPIENMPTLLQVLSRVVPARYLIAILRGVMLQGRGLEDVWPNLVYLALLGLAIVAATTKKFQRRLA